MYQGFPIEFIDLVRCCKDGGLLKADDSDRDKKFIVSGEVVCQQCGTTYEISEGILDLFSVVRPRDERSLFEVQQRDRMAEEVRHTSVRENNIMDEMEVPSTLKRLGDTVGKSILELGCGTGRFTRLLTETCDLILAVDFSRKSLLVNARNLPQCENVGLIQADVSRLILLPNSFDLALSTLYSNLPSLEIRTSSNKAVFNALKAGGRYVLSAHHHEFREILKGIPAEGEYDNGIYYRQFTIRSLKEELSVSFPQINFHTICIWLPYISRIKSIRVIISKVCERIPVLNKMGSLLLATATKN